MKNQLEPGEFVQGLAVPLAATAAPGARLQDQQALRLRHLGAVRRLRDRARRRHGEGSAPGLRRHGRDRQARGAGRGRAASASPGRRPASNAAKLALAQDFKPLTDMRASADYRLQVAQNLLQRLWLETRTDGPAAGRGHQRLERDAARSAASKEPEHEQAPRSQPAAVRRSLRRLPDEHRRAHRRARRGQGARRRRARRHQPAARIGAPARGRRGHLHRRHPRTRGHAALRAGPVAGGQRPAQGHEARRDPRHARRGGGAHGGRHPRQQRLRLDRPRRPDPVQTATSATSASRCSR